LEHNELKIYIENSIKQTNHFINPKNQKTMMTLAKLIIEIILAIF